jgi:hypothetical protein
MAVIAADEKRPRRRSSAGFTGAALGGETLTRCYELVEGSRCFALIRDPVRNGARRSSHPCGGRLEGRFA